MPEFKFEGFIPSSKIKSTAKELLWSLESQAPSQAQPHAMLKQISQQEYLGNISFTSGDITLNAEFIDESPQKVLDKLKFQMKDAIKKWLSSRF